MDQSPSDNTIGDMEEEVEMVGRAFVDHYYNLFDLNRSELVSLYQSTSMLTFEGQKIQGVSDISAKLDQLPFDQCRHMISTVDSQPSVFCGGILVFVSGSLQLLGEEHPLRFSQVDPMFQLIPTGLGKANLCKATYFASTMVDMFLSKMEG